MVRMSLAAKNKPASGLTEVQIKDILKAALKQSIAAHSTGDVKEIKRTNAELKALRNEVQSLSKGADKNQDALIESYDELIENIHNNSVVLEKLKNVYSKADLKKDWESFRKGMFSQINPLVATGFRVVKSAYGFVKETAAVKAADAKLLKGIDAKLIDKGGPQPPAANQPTVPKNNRAPVPKATPTPAPKATPAPKKATGEGPFITAMKAVQASSEKQTVILERIATSLEGTKQAPSAEKTESTPASTQTAVRSSPVPSQTPPKLTKREKRLAELASQSTPAVKVETAQAESKESGPIKIEADELKHLPMLDEIRKDIATLLKYNAEQIQVAKEARIDANKAQLQALDDQKEADAKKFAANAKATGTTAQKEEGKGGGFLSNMMSEIIGEVIGNKLGKGGGLIKKLGGMLKFLAPSAILGGVATMAGKAGGLIEGAKALPGKAISGIKSIGESVGNLASKGLSKVKGALNFGSKVVGEGAEAMSGPLSKVMKIGGDLLKGVKTIPVIGQILTAILAITDFASGFMGASDILDKKEMDLTLWDKISAGFAKVVGGFVSIVDGLSWLLGFDTDFAGTVTKSLGKALSEFPTNVVNWFDDFFADITSNIKIGLLKAAKGILSVLPGGDLIASSLGLDDKIKSAEADKAADQKARSADPNAKKPSQVVVEKSAQALDALKEGAGQAAVTVGKAIVDPAGTAADLFSKGKEAISNFFSTSKDNEKKIQDMKDAQGAKAAAGAVVIDAKKNTSINQTTINGPQIAVRNSDDAWKVGLDYGFPI